LPLGSYIVKTPFRVRLNIQEDLSEIRGQRKRVQKLEDLSLIDVEKRRALSARFPLSPLVAVDAGASLVTMNMKLSSAMLAEEEARQRIYLCSLSNRQGIPSAPMAGLLSSQKQVIIEQWIVSAWAPHTGPVWQFTQIEAILQERSDGVLGERIGAAVASCAVTPLVEQSGDLSI
jgi:hypothetical protein